MGGKLAQSNPFTAMIAGEHELNLANADAAEKDAEYNAAQRKKQAERLTKEQVAAVGASGIELDGSALDVIKQDRQEAEIEAMNIRYSGKMKAAYMRRASKLQRDGAYMNLILKGASLAMSANSMQGAGSAKGMDARSTGTNGYTMSDNASSYGKDIA